MSERPTVATAPESVGPWPLLVVATGLALLLLRPAPLGPDTAWAILLAVYPALAVASLTTPLGNISEQEMLHPLVVLALGIAVVAASPVFSGPAPSRPFGVGSIPFVVAAAVAEEALFRRLLYGRLLAYGGAVAIGVSAFAFALVHLPTYGTTALPLDLGAGVLLSWQRWASGTWTVPAATHTAANVLAALR